jgi:hypothetical protein
MRVGPTTPSVPTTWPSTVGCGDQAAFVERQQVRFAADEDLHAGRMRDWSSSCSSPVFCSNSVEQAAQAAHVAGQIRRVEQVAAAGHDDVFLAAGLAAGVHRCGHQARDVVTHAAEFIAQLGANLVEAVAGEVLVEVIGRFGQRS